jgi:hypothetical protein
LSHIAQSTVSYGIVALTAHAQPRLAEAFGRIVPDLQHEVTAQDVRDLFEAARQERGTACEVDAQIYMEIAHMISLQASLTFQSKVTPEAWTELYLQRDTL